MMFIIFYSEKQTELINTLLGQSGKLVRVKAVSKNIYHCTINSEYSVDWKMFQIRSVEISIINIYMLCNHH
jgi:hypothetical protein